MTHTTASGRHREREGQEEFAGELLERTSEIGQRASRALHDAVLEGGEPARRVADLLHGTWLGHPLHPALTDATVGAWTFGVVFDALAAVSGDRNAERAGDALTAMGVATAVPTALAGMVDYSTVPKHASRNATIHALLNGAGLALNAVSLRERRKGRRGRATTLSAIAFGATMASAWLGGHLVYRQRVGVDHGESFSGPREWAAVLPADELAVGESRRLRLDEGAVLLHRSAEDVHALAAVCNHAGGPLDQGEIRGCFVRCPWHDSEFDLRDGSVRHGPATRAQTAFDARIRGGWIEIRKTAGSA